MVGPVPAIYRGRVPVGMAGTIPAMTRGAAVTCSASSARPYASPSTSLSAERDARLTLPDGTRLTRDQEVVTYVDRNLEPYRGFPALMRALPQLLALRPNARVVIVGGDGTSYGPPPSEGGTWREVMLREIGGVDPARVTFTGGVPHATFIALMQISRVHQYLSIPFVLSWSCLEAMAAGGLVVAARTTPIQEVTEDGRNGLLVDLRDPAAIADRTAEALAAGSSLDPLRLRARETAVTLFALRRCLAEQMRLVRSLA